MRFLYGQPIDGADPVLRISLSWWESLPMPRPGGVTHDGLWRSLRSDGRAMLIFVEGLKAIVLRPIIRVPARAA